MVLLFDTVLKVMLFMPNPHLCLIIGLITDLFVSCVVGMPGRRAFALPLVLVLESALGSAS